MAEPTSIREAIIIGATLLVVSAIIGVLLSWPRNVAMRAAFILVLSCLTGLRGLDSLDTRSVAIALLSGLPVAFLFVIIAAADWLVALIWNRLSPRPSAQARS